MNYIYSIEEFLNEGSKPMKLKYYHTSGHKFKKGDMIGGPGQNVFMSNTPVPHYTIWDIVEHGFKSYEDYSKETIKRWNQYWDQKEKNPDEPSEGIAKVDLSAKKPINLYVYEVLPHGKIVFNRSNDEWVSINSFVEIIDVVGNARGILQNYRRKIGNGKHSIAGAKAITKQQRANEYMPHLNWPRREKIKNR